MLKHRDISAIDVRATAENDLRTLARKRTIEIGGVSQRFVSDTESEEVFRFATVHFLGHDTVFDRIKSRQGGNETAPLGIDSVVRVSVGVVNYLSAPLLRRFANGVDFPQDVLPK